MGVVLWLCWQMVVLFRVVHNQALLSPPSMLNTWQPFLLWTGQSLLTFLSNMSRLTSSYNTPLFNEEQILVDRLKLKASQFVFCPITKADQVYVAPAHALACRALRAFLSGTHFIPRGSGRQPL